MCVCKCYDKMGEVVMVKQLWRAWGNNVLSAVCEETSGNCSHLGYAVGTSVALEKGWFPVSPQCFHCKMKCTVKLSVLISFSRVKAWKCILLSYNRNICF